MSHHTAFAPGAAGRRPGETVELDPAEAAHLRALRVFPGDSVGLTDGRGGVWRARLEEGGRAGARCTLLSAAEAPPTLPVELAFAVANKERTLWLVEKGVELGARALRPVEFRRSRSVSDAARSAAFWKKAERRTVAALKQCGGGWLPEIRETITLEGYLRELREERGASPVGSPAPTGRPGSDPGDGGSLRLVAVPGAGERLVDAVGGWRGERAVRLLVGPEGGLEPGEVEACRGVGFRPVSLGLRTLRFETAAVAALGILAQLYGRGPGEGRLPPG